MARSRILTATLHELWLRKGCKPLHRLLLQDHGYPKVDGATSGQILLYARVFGARRALLGHSPKHFGVWNLFFGLRISVPLEEAVERLAIHAGRRIDSTPQSVSGNV